MCGCFGWMGKGCGSCLAFIFVFSFATAIWSFNINRRAIQADSNFSDLLSEDFYDSILPAVLPSLAENPQNEVKIGELDFSSVVENLEFEDWQAISAEVVPGAFLEEQTEENVAIFLEFLRGERARLDVEFDTGVLRENLLGQPGDRMVNRIFSTWEDCDKDDEAQVQDWLKQEGANFPYCKPIDTDLQLRVFSSLNASKDELARSIPEVWNVREQFAEKNNLTLRETDQRFYEDMQRGAVLSLELNPLNILLNLAWLALIVIFAVDSAKSFFLWMGIPLTITGIFVLLPLGIIPLFIPAAFGNAQDNVHSIESETVRSVILSLVSQFTMPILVQGAVLVAVGFACIFIFFFLRSAEQSMMAFDASSTGYP
ncbi:MAG TPA: hypothetical protein VJZ27_14780, partial [Aggregatilineales bacterium]|nr:hypothetical protein [Aggregatilineales bacterium]